MRLQTPVASVGRKVTLVKLYKCDMKRKIRSLNNAHSNQVKVL